MSVGFSSSDAREYSKGIRAFNGGKYAEAMSEFEVAARSDDHEALTYLALMFNQGLGTPRNPKRAYELYTRLAEKGDRGAMVKLGELTAEGIAVQTNRGIARAWYEKALANGLSGSYVYCRMAELEEPDSENAGNPQERARLLKKATEETIFPSTECASNARRKLAVTYAKGIGVPNNSCMSVKLKGELVAYGGDRELISEGQKARDPEIQSVILAMIVSQYNRHMNSKAKPPTLGEDAFVKAVLSDYAEPGRSLLLAVLTKNGLGVPRDLDKSNQLANGAISKMSDEQLGNGMSMKESARQFYEFDFSCLQLSR